MGLSPLSPAAAATDLRLHAETIESGEASYVVAVGGTADGASMRDPVGYGNYAQTWENNIRLRLANIGDDVILNPWIDVDGRQRWRSTEEILAGVLHPGMDDAAKARAIWEFARHHRYHKTTGDDEVKDTVKMLNVYGYTLCWDEAYTVSNLWQAAGLKIRRGLPHGHCTTEVWFDGKYHLLDSDEHLLVLERDNETIAGETELSRDHDLMKRSHGYGVLSPEDRRRSEDAASLFCHVGPRTGGRAVIGDHRMDLTLRPGEALTWAWDEGRGRYHGSGPPPRFCNGALEFTPRLDRTFERWTEATRDATSDGASVTASSLTWRFAAPYVIVGGGITLRLGAVPVRLELQRGDGDWLQVEEDLTGEVEVDLDACFPPESAATYEGCLRLSGDALMLHALRLELALQMAPLSLPDLRLGDNTVHYTDDADQRRVEITHAWRERDDLQPPAAPALLAPPDAGRVSGTAVTLRWRDTAGEGGDYHVRLGQTEDLEWALSPVFDKLVSRTPSAGRAEWTVPEEGLLNPDTTYYWHVRARSADGLWGPWSLPASFTPKAPALPADLALRMDWERRVGTLHWRRGDAGTAVTRWEIYGSDERGFSVSPEAYTIVSGESDPQGTRTMPANLLACVDGDVTQLDVVGAGLPHNRAFYRVVAVDAEGARSGATDYVEAPRPFVHSPLPARIPAGKESRVVLRAISALGDLRAESDGPHRYRKAIRDGDVLDFILDEGPAFVALDAATGELAFTPGPEHASTHTVTVRVRNGQGGVDVVGFDVEVIL